MATAATADGPNDEKNGLGEDDFIPRAYQVLLHEKAVKQNTILFLPTGSGKTYVAIMLIKQLATEIEKPYLEGGKRTFFMVNTVALVHQQASVIRRLLPFTVGEYSGDMNVDFWHKERWQEELIKNQILVMTSQIFLDMLCHSYLSLTNTNLLIFDECHHGVNDHPMRQIMQRFEACPLAEQPRVLGLSATLILGSCKVTQVTKSVETLEVTFHSKVATIEHEQVANVATWSTNPMESIEVFTETAPDAIIEKAIDLVQKYQTFVANVKWPHVSIAPPPDRYHALLNLPHKKDDKTLRNLLVDLMIHINMMGVYGGSLACLAHLINLERKRMRCDTEIMEKLYTTLISGLTLVNKHLEAAMEGLSDMDKIMTFSTDKVIRLIKLLGKHYAQREESKPFCVIVFVQRRFTAKVVFHILKAIQTADPLNYGFLRPDFIVGLNQNPMHDTRAGQLEHKHNSMVIQRFNAGVTNVIVSSDVLEEGIDVPHLSLVIKFDLPSNHSSYIQSKGRARHQKSHYVMMVSANEKASFLGKYHSYQEVEHALKCKLIGQTDVRQGPTVGDIADVMYDHLVPPYYAHGHAVPGSPCITMSSAVQLVNRYCSMLPQDKFTTLSPTWFINKVTKAVSLQMPMNSKLKDVVTGLTAPVVATPGFVLTKKFAKRSAALETCKRLHAIGELDDRLLPRGSRTKILDDNNLFPMWEAEDGNEDRDDTQRVGGKKGTAPKPGTRKMIRTHRKKFPESLSECSPQPGAITYVYHIRLNPSYPRPEVNRKVVFYELLRLDQGFAILTSKKLPQVCEFSIFLNVGEIQVLLEPEPSEVRLTAERIATAKRFSAMVFNEALRLEKKFIINDNANMENAYVVVPTKAGEVDWGTVDEHKEVPEIRMPSEEERKVLKFDGLMHAVIAPWYRGSLRDQNYIVTRVCDEMTPQSPFPSAERLTYDSYFAEKYSTTIHHPRQPLVEVKAISTKMHCIKPRPKANESTRSKRKLQEMNDDFEEHLVPELCDRFSFPAVLWLKATCLPTVLHRLVHLLLAEELRMQIARDLSLGAVTLPAGVKWQPLAVDSKCTNRETKPESLLGIMSAGTTKPLKPDRMWGDEQEPVDINRIRLDLVRLVEIQYYENFVRQRLPPVVPKEYVPVEVVPVKKIALLSNKPVGTGPQQFEIFQALTATTANDIVNLERSETLGDSFLKLAISQFLYQHYGDLNEGELSSIKGKLVGNRNLYYCGKARGIPSVMKVFDFSPSADFVPPGMCVPRFLRELIELSELSPNVLFNLQIPREERLLGLMSQETVDQLGEQLIEASEDLKAPSAMEVFLGKQSVKDKVVADGVESLIGAYLKSCGVRGALQLVGWLHILPSALATPEVTYDRPPPSALLLPDGDVNHFLRQCTTLEQRIGYTFRDRSYLLQALTHPSFDANRITENYQRLEFLGDAILDFLITCHIYEECGALTPGELTDLRSSLVNNVYFASLVVRLGIHQFMLMSSPRLLDITDKFVRYQEERNHAVSEQVLYLVEERETKIAECIDVPKVLGDLFESLAGAIYLDSNMSLETVWDVFYRLMHKEITEFSCRVPKQPVRLLYERLGQNKPVFHETVLVPNTNMVMVQLEIVINGKKSFYHGFGLNKVLARTAAAKIAMKHWQIDQ